MPATLLYFITILVWSLTWLAIHYQLGVVSPMWSVGYRFGVAGVLILLFSLITRRNLRYSWHIHGILILQGALLFSFNFLLFYWGSQYLISGISAVIFATIVAMNIINARIFFKTPFTLKTLLGASLGFMGLLVVFWGEIKMALIGDRHLNELLQGAGLCVAATFVASLGNMLSKFLQIQDIPVMQGNGFSMVYGFLLMGLFATCLGQPMTFDFSWTYILSLGYLIVFGSIIGFGSYLKLIGTIGPEKAAYVFVVVPVLALLVSSVVENFTWSSGTVAGLLFIIAGNCLILSRSTAIPSHLPWKKIIAERPRN